MHLPNLQNSEYLRKARKLRKQQPVRACLVQHISTIYQLCQRTQLHEGNPARGLDMDVLLCVWLHTFITTIIRLLLRLRSRIRLIEKRGQLVFTHLHLEHITNYVSLCSVTSNCSRTMIQALSSHSSPNSCPKISKSNEMHYRQRHCAH